MMEELESYSAHIFEMGCMDQRVYLKSDVDKVIADLKESHKMEVEQLLMEIAGLRNRIAPKQSDKTLQERVNEVCEKHGVSTLQDLDWAFCMVEARLEDYIKLAAEKHEALDKMEQYKVLYKELCRDINTQERFFAEDRAHDRYKRCRDKATICKLYLERYERCLSEHKGYEGLLTFERWRFLRNHYEKWHKRWLGLSKRFKEDK